MTAQESTPSHSDDGNTVVDDAKGKEIPLPANTSGLKYKYTSEYYNYNFKADTVVEVHPTANMKSILQADKEQYGYSYISSSAKVSYSENGQAGMTTNTEGNPLKIQSVAMTRCNTELCRTNFVLLSTEYRG